MHQRVHKLLAKGKRRVYNVIYGGDTMFFFFDVKPYIAIIGDIRESKKIHDRNDVQMRLKNVLEVINDKYNAEVSAKFMITLGDEFQGLLWNGTKVLDIIEEIQREMYPVQIRFGIGVGEITTNINAEMAIGADGPGYYKAREALEFLKKEEQKNKVPLSDIRIEVEEEKSNVSNLLNTIFSLMEVIKGNWTQRQREIIYEYESTEGSQLECARKLEITQSSVQRSLKKGNYYEYTHAKATVNSVLCEIGEVDV